LGLSLLNSFEQLHSSGNSHIRIQLITKPLNDGIANYSDFKIPRTDFAITATVYCVVVDVLCNVAHVLQRR